MRFTEICVPGEENDPNNSSVCVECPLNTYNDAQGESCKPCPADSITQSTGQRSPGDCIGKIVKTKIDLISN